MSTTPRTPDYSPSFRGTAPFDAPTPFADDRGRLLIEEGREDIEKTGKAYVRRGGYLVALGGLTVALGFLNFIIGLTPVLTLMSMMLLMVASVSIASGLTLMFMSRKLKPVRIYENGIEGTALMGTRTYFFPFGKITAVTETTDSINGPVYVFRTTELGQSIAIRKRTRNFSEMLEVTRVKITREQSAVKWDVSPEEGVRSRKLEYGLYATAAIVGVVVSVMFILFVFPGQTTSFMLSALGMVMPIFIMLAVTYMTFRMMNMQKHVPRRLNVKVPAVIIALTLAFSYINIGLEASAAAPAPIHYDIYIEPKPASSSLAPGTYVNATLGVNGWILVDSGQILRLVNTSLTMDLSSDKGFGIWVAAGGTLMITGGSRVLSSDPAFGYTFEINGSALIDASTIAGVWADPRQVNYNGGLEIYSSDVIINATNLPDAKLNGILIMNSDPTIANSTIANAGDDGIEMHGSKAHIVGNTIKNCNYAMIIADGSDALIENNNFIDNLHGIALESSSPTIRANHFEHNYNYAISYDSASHMVLENNVFINNQVDTVEASGLYVIGACGVITAALAAVCILILFWIRREQLRNK